MQKVTVRFSDNEHQALLRHSEVVERSLNELIREAVREYLNIDTPTKK